MNANGEYVVFDPKTVDVKTANILLLDARMADFRIEE